MTRRGNRINRSTGVINRPPTRAPVMLHIHSSDRYNHYTHAHTHYHHASRFSVASRVIGWGLRTGSSIRRNSFSIFAIFAIILFYLGLIAKTVNPGTTYQYTFTGFLQYMSNVGNVIDGNFFVEHYRSTQAVFMGLIQFFDWDLPGIFNVLNPIQWLETLIRFMLTVYTVLHFICECLWSLFGFVMAIFTYIFAPLTVL